MKIVSILQKGETSRLKNMKIDANGTEIRVMGDVVNEDAYISLTDIAKYKNPDNVHFTELSGRHSVLERPLSEVNGRLFFS